ncbi:unnamed protein product [Callosobruchus maculatus]|uniref:CDK-activating kinase assembly factor MAT1 n=1 Tax=Callosobruchus maculatus TaxID=64391 RepID=A0A653D4P3_CALMS|nr:unnamed protein product [Callosobruchus maculatus]
MDDFTCPRCRTSKFQNPSLKMMVNVCGHGLCESCVDLLFLKGSGSCPECKIPLRRNNFRVQLFEDATVEKEVDIRKRVLRDFNKKEEDFTTLKEYNDYLEEVESIIFNLTNNIDVVNTNKRIEQYKRDNKEQIMKNKGKLGRDEYELEEILELEKQMEEQRKAQQAKEESAKKLPQRATKFSTGIQIGRQSNTTFLPVPIDEGPLYTYKPISLPVDGPKPPTTEEIVSRGFINHVRTETEQERAGGFKSIIACSRALQDAMSGLFHSKKSSSVH